MKNELFRGVSGPGVAGNGFSAKNDNQFKGRDSNPGPGDPFRGHFPSWEKLWEHNPPPTLPEEFFVKHMFFSLNVLWFRPSNGHKINGSFVRRARSPGRPLVWAALNGALDVMALLVRHGASPSLEGAGSEHLERLLVERRGHEAPAVCKRVGQEA